MQDSDASICPAGKALWGLPLAFIVAGFAALLVDAPLAQWAMADSLPRDVRKLLDLAEVFGHGLGITAIIVTVLVVDRQQRWKIPRLALATAAAGLLANLIKLMIARVRPHHFSFEGSIASSFLGWWPLGTGPSFQQGCPSGHTAAAAGLAVGLAWMYPHGRSWFACLAVLVATQRIESGAHFLSDTLWGAAVGIIAARAVLALPSLGCLGNRLERYLGKPDSNRQPTSVCTCNVA